MLNDNTHINYSKADIEKYLQGKMTASEMHALEKAALQDPFLADAIEGFEIADTIKSNNALAKTEAMILESTTQKEYSLNDIEQYYSTQIDEMPMNVAELIWNYFYTYFTSWSGELANKFPV